MDMTVLIKAIGVIFILMGVLYIARPDIPRKLIGFFKKGNRIYAAGVVRLVLAIIFFIASGHPDITHPWLVIVIGILFVISALIIFMAGPKKLGGMLEWYDNQGPTVFRIIAAIVILFGILVLYAA